MFHPLSDNHSWIQCARFNRYFPKYNYNIYYFHISNNAEKEFYLFFFKKLFVAGAISKVAFYIEIPFRIYYLRANSHLVVEMGTGRKAGIA